MHPLIQRKQSFSLFFVALAFLCFGLPPCAQAVSPTPDGCYPGFTTAEGCDALNALTTGSGNTGLGWRSLFLDTTGSFNTGVGAGALALNNGDSNTAVGAAALLLNTSGAANVAVGTDALVFNDSGGSNSAVGAFALFENTTGVSNTAVGARALSHNTSGAENTAVGILALVHNDSGSYNNAVGAFALYENTTGLFNNAFGRQSLTSNVDGRENNAFGNDALFSNTSGSFNTALGDDALYENTTGYDNTALGDDALYSNTTGHDNVANGNQALYSNTTGYYNVANGAGAGSDLTIGSGNVCIGSDVPGVAGASNTTWIANVFASVASGRAVYVNSDNKIGTLSSSRRYKEEVKPMGQASETLFGLKPVTFRYKKEVDRSQALSFGLIAEEVAEISPDLITRDKEGKPYTVRYEAVNAMLLNEFLKEHNKVQEQGTTIAELKSTVAQQQKQIEALTAGLQKVSARIEASRPTLEVVNNNQ